VTAPIGTSTAATPPQAPYGLPDLSVTITSLGYLTLPSTDSFVASTTAPYGTRPAIKFVVKNIGTNIASSWRFIAAIPTVNSYVYQSQAQQPLNPGDSIEYTLGFDQAAIGSNQSISITADSDHTILESNEENNTATASMNVQ